MCQACTRPHVGYGNHNIHDMWYIDLDASISNFREVKHTMWHLNISTFVDYLSQIIDVI
jgi:hypothetical protein